MKRLGVAIALVGAAVTCAAVAAASPPRTVEYQLVGSSDWSASFQPASFTLAGSIYDGERKVGTYSGTLSAGTYYTTNDCGPACAPITGTITATTRRGRLTFTVDQGGLVVEFAQSPHGQEYNFTIPLTVVGGTRVYKRAIGWSGLLSYDSSRAIGLPECDFGPCPIEDAGTLTFGP